MLGPVQAFPEHGQMSPEQAEIACLKKELARLGMRDILRRAAAYFAKEST